MASVGVHCLLVVFLLVFTVAQKSQPPYQVIPSPPNGDNNGCCYGRLSFSNGQAVTSLPEFCVSLVCVNGNIEPRHFSKPGTSGCCEFDGQMYPDGAELSSYCVPLVCRGGNWTYSNKIEECCKLCNVYNDPHFKTFDGHYYDWHGDCNYTITQTGRTHYPDVGVFSDFRPCFGGIPGASCLHLSTFRNDKHTVITLDHTASSVFSILVNGHAFLVPASGVHAVSSAVTHPVLAWRDGSCLFLAGSSRILVRHCHHQLNVWAYPAHTNQLDGLCGHFNFYQNDDMTSRDGIVHPLHTWPEAFPDSWRTSDQTDRKCLAPCQYCKEAKSNPCSASAQEMEMLRSQCAVIYFILGRDLTLKHHVETCAWDLCMARQAGVPVTEQQLWLVEVIKIVTDARMMEVVTSGSFKQQLAPAAGACTPGSRWKRSCNWCTCRQDYSADCSQTACQADYQHAAGTDACVDDSLWRHDDCNWCLCIRGGHICTYDDCTGGVTQPTIYTIPTLPTLPTEEVCFLRHDAGSCQGNEVRYYYNYFYGRCTGFFYTGCAGNANNFRSEAECLTVCGHLTTHTTQTTTTSTTTPSRPPQCNLQPKTGPCLGSYLRYYYNATTDTCELFTYGGCAGNGNRFDSQGTCEDFCRASTKAPTYSTRPSPTFVYTAATNRPPHCSLSPERGSCYNKTLRYYFNPNTETCQTFTYTGCGGNNNNFMSEEWCVASCALQASTTATVSTELPTKCYQDVDVGDCYDNLWRYYYNSTRRKCDVFLYGGCGGNDNKFISQEECEAACGGQTQSTTAATTTVNRCYLPKDHGHCTDSIRRYYYNYDRQQCEEFTYGGCGGNLNNFINIYKCMEACQLRG